MSQTAQEMKLTLGWVAFAFGLLLLIVAGGWAWRYFMAPIAGQANAEWQIESAESRIASYEKFFNQCAAIQGYESALAAQKASLEGASREETSRIRTNIAGITAQRGRAIAQYNVDAQKTYTSGRFFDPRLPQSISAEQENTKCLVP